MILGIGTDVAKVARFERALARHGARFPARLLGSAELTHLGRHAHPAAFLAKRFAAKEAFLKALGTGLRHGMRWTQVQVINDAQGRPGLVLSGQAQVLAKQAGVERMHLSISDESGLAVAFVVLEN